MKKVLLIILDGFGESPISDFNAIKNANTPFLDFIKGNFPNTTIFTSGVHVGLPKGQMGNSEVGHMNIGAGRIVSQESTRIDESIFNRSFLKNKVLLDAFKKAQENKKNVHFLGMLSDGGIHSHQNHLYALLQLAKRCGVSPFLHLFTDGRDTSPKSGLEFVKKLTEKIASIKTGTISSISGRYFAMDRDNRWERIKRSYQAMTQDGKTTPSYPTAEIGIQDSYQKNITDEFIVPFSVEHTAKVKSKDCIVFFNFRADRAKQISRAFSDEFFSSFTRPFLNPNFIQFTEYDKSFPLPTVFEKINIKNTLGEVLAQDGFYQFRCAETEKYAHVTFFFNGGKDIVFENEFRKMIPSPKVATYDMKPEMSAPGLTKVILDAIKSKKYQFIVTNYANADMVGHTGVYSAAVKAIETLDDCLKKLIPYAQKNKFDTLITADHGNSEQMINFKTREPFTQHTTGPVPLFYIGEKRVKLLEGGSLQDIAPTILTIMEKTIPKEMTGKSLVWFL